jgi:hypothetical protein
MKHEIDNPGGGDCGFYAFSIGLIEIIQNEHQAKKVSPTFQQWVAKGLVGVDLDELLKIDLQILRQAPNKYEKPLLAKLQMSLRSIAAEASKEDLILKMRYEAIMYDELSEVEGSPIYGKFMELVKVYMARGTSTKLHDDLYKFNELALSPEVRKLAQQTAVKLAPQLKGKNFQDKQALENTYVKKILIKDLNSDPSCILHGVDSIKKQGRWATHSDLKVVAVELHVNLLVTNNQNGAINDSLPTVTLINKANVHWTTTVDLPELQLRAAKTVQAKPTPVIKPSESSLTETARARELTREEEQVMQITASSQHREDKIAPYKEHLKTLIHAASSQGLYSNVSKQWVIIKEALNKKIATNNSGEQRNLTPGQSIFLAIKACKEEGISKEIIDELKSLYLNGVRTKSDKEAITQIGQYLSDNHNYSITTRHEDINNDPLRRYFETHTAYQMLKSSAKSLKTEELHAFTNNLKTNLYKYMPSENRGKMEYILAGIMHPSLNKYEQEYAEMIGQLKSHNFHGLSPKACNNLCEIARSTILATNNTMFDKQMPADIYAESIFTMGMDGRGRTGRGDQNRAGSSFKGLIREGTPLPEGDIARSTQSPFLRSADQASYMIESQWSQHLFSRQTQVFSNGISSTTLATLRNILMQKRLGNNHHADDFQSYMTAFASLMIFNSGGHSLFEIFEVFKLPQLRELMVETGADNLIDSDTLLDEWLLKGQSEVLDKAFEVSSKYFDEFGAEIILTQTNSPAIENKNGTMVHQAVIDMDKEKFAEFLEANKSEIAAIDEKSGRKLIDEKNSSQYTAFMVAAQIGKLDHVKMLHEAGVNVMRSMSQSGRKTGVTAFEVAIKSEKFPVVEYLLANVPQLTIKKANTGDLRDRAPALYYACRQKYIRILDKIIEKSAGEKHPLTNIDKKLALEEMISFENQEGMVFLLEKLEQIGIKLNRKEKHHLLEAAAGRGNVQLFNTLLNSNLLSPKDEVDFSACMDIASAKNYVPIIKEVLSSQYLLENARSKIPQSKLDDVMNRALQNHQFGMAVLAILYGANPSNMPIDKNAIGFAEYLKNTPPETFDAFFNEKDKEIIQTRTNALQQIHSGTNSFGEKLLNLLCKFLSILPGVNLGTYYDKRRDAVTRIAYQVLTNEPKTNAELGLEERKSPSEYDPYIPSEDTPYRSGRNMGNSSYSLFASGKPTQPSETHNTHRDHYDLSYGQDLRGKTIDMKASLKEIVKEHETVPDILAKPLH